MWCCEHTAVPQTDDSVLNRPRQWTSSELGWSLVGATCRGYILVAISHDGPTTADLHIDKNVTTCRSYAGHGRPYKLRLDSLGCFVFTYVSDAGQNIMNVQQNLITQSTFIYFLTVLWQLRGLDQMLNYKSNMTQKNNLAFTHHGASGVGVSCCADLWGESQSAAETSWAGQLPIQSCVGHHAKMSRVWTGGHRHGTAESWGGTEKRKEGLKDGHKEGKQYIAHKHSHRGTEKNGNLFLLLDFISLYGNKVSDQGSVKYDICLHWWQQRSR